MKTIKDETNKISGEIGFEIKMLIVTKSDANAEKKKADEKMILKIILMIPFDKKNEKPTKID